MRLRGFEVLLMVGAGWTALAAGPAFGASCDQKIEQVRSELAQGELSGAERRQYDTLLGAARALQQNGGEQLCIEILNQTRTVLQRRAATARPEGQPYAARPLVPKNARPLSQIVRFDGIRDLDVVNPKGQRLDQIVDLVVNFDSHQVQYALLSMSSGLLGDQKLYPVPIDVLEIGDAPEPKPARADGTARSSGARASSGGLAGDGQDGIARLGAIAQMAVGDLVGSEVRNDRNDSVGEIDAVILPPEGAQIEAVLSVGGVLGVGDRLVAIPLDRLTVGEDGLRFKEPVTEDELKQLPKIEVGDQERLPDDTVVAEVAPAAQPSASGPTPAADSDALADPLAQKMLVLDIERATLEQAPGFTEGTYPELADPEWHRTVLSFYENVLHLDGDRAKTMQQPGAPAGTKQR